MRMVFVSCSRRAMKLAQDSKRLWQENIGKDHIDIIVKCRNLKPEAYSGVCVLEDRESLASAVERCFGDEQCECIVFFCAVGIAVRTIAPFIQHKAIDPAVVVVDETGKFCISLLSGHIGGANKICENLSDLIGAEPVITTASDRNNTFSPDVYTVNNGLVLTDFKMSKIIAAAALDRQKIGLSDEEGCFVIDAIGEKIGPADEKVHYGICITNREDVEPPFESTLFLYKRNLVLGIGCRKGIDREAIKTAVRDTLSDNNLSINSVKAIATIDIKAGEPGLVNFAKKYGIQMVAFGNGQLRDIENRYPPDFFSESKFVKDVTGVKCVCEESVFAFGASKLLVRKTIHNGVTVAVGLM